MKKTEKIMLLEKSVNWFREESIKLAKNLDKCKENNQQLNQELKEAIAEIEMWREAAKTLKWQNIVLKDTIGKLKSKTQIAKYEEHGRQKAKVEFDQALS